MAFKIRAEFEDLVIDATGFNMPVGSSWTYTCIISDNVTGDCRSVTLTDRQLAMVLEFNLDNNGEPPGFEEYYKELEPIFKGWPQHLRPIP